MFCLSLLLRRSPESPKSEDITRYAGEFDEKLSRCGIFLGREKVESIKSQIGGPFLKRLVGEIQNHDPQNLKRMLTQFQDHWMSILDELQKELDEQL